MQRLWDSRQCVCTSDSFPTSFPSGDYCGAQTPLSKDSGLSGRAVPCWGLTLQCGAPAARVHVNSSTFHPCRAQVTVAVLPPRRTSAVKLKITLSATRDDEGGWMAGPRHSSTPVLNFTAAKQPGLYQPCVHVVLKKKTNFITCSYSKESSA